MSERASSESEDPRERPEKTEFDNHEKVSPDNVVARCDITPGKDATQTYINIGRLREALDEYEETKGKSPKGYLTVVEDGPVFVSTFRDGDSVGVAPIVEPPELEDDDDD